MDKNGEKRTSLRDELVEKKRLEKERQDANTRIREENEAKRQAQAKQDAQKREENAASRFEALKSEVERGNPPEEWVKLYDKYIEKIKKTLSGATDEFSFTETVSKDYYEQKEAVRSGKETERTLMNAFLTQKLKDEGFKNVVFELFRRSERYATEEDFARQSRQQEAYDAQAQAKYDADVARYNSGSYEYMAAPESTDRAYRPKTATLSKSGIRYFYEIVVRGSLYSFDKAKQSKTESMSSFSVTCPVVLFILGFIGGFYFYIKGGIFGKDIGALAPFIVAFLGALLGLTVSGMEKCVRTALSSLANDRLAKKIKVRAVLLCVLLFLVLLAAFAGIAGLLIREFLATR